MTKTWKSKNSGFETSLDLSFIVCTRNRSNALKDCFDSIASACAQFPSIRAELIVVDNASTDNTSASTQAWAETSMLPVTLVYEAQPGLSRARNAGLREARGKLIAFTDDDCRLAPNYVRDLFHYFQSDTGPTLRGGRVELGDPLDLPLTIKTDNEKMDYAHPMHPAGFIHGANMTMSRTVVDRLGLFDERFGAGTQFPGEDCDYIIRAHAAGIRVQYVPDMVVFHFHGRRGKDEAQKLFKGYMRANGALYIKHLRSSPLLMRHLWWDIKYWYQEMRGRNKKLLGSVDIGHRQVVVGNIIGMIHYSVDRAKTYIGDRLTKYDRHEKKL